MRLNIIAFFFLMSCGQFGSYISNETNNLKAIETYLTDTSVLFLWRDMKYDTTLKDSFNSIFLNQEYLFHMTDPEKAAVGYIATFIGNECWWDGNANEDRSNLDCKIISALGLGYQCSDSHLGFLRKWFSGDEKVISELEHSNCPTTPYTATIQDTFDEISLSVSGDTIIVEYKANSVNIREQESWAWSAKLNFQFKNEQLSLVKKEESDVIHEKFEMSEE